MNAIRKLDTGLSHLTSSVVDIFYTYTWGDFKNTSSDIRDMTYAQRKLLLKRFRVDLNRFQNPATYLPLDQRAGAPRQVIQTKNAIKQIKAYNILKPVIGTLIVVGVVAAIAGAINKFKD